MRSHCFILFEWFLRQGIYDFPRKDDQKGEKLLWEKFMKIHGSVLDNEEKVIILHSGAIQIK